MILLKVFFVSDILKVKCAVFGLFFKEETAASSGSILDCGSLSLASPEKTSVRLKYAEGPKFKMN